jgi:antitoxin (DNA-binding transcriptional repressor) of toxin-antitoxin stability system
MPISKFKATCLAELETVRRTGRPLRITRFGRPVADIVAPAPDEVKRRALGGMVERGRVVGDITSPLNVTWESMSS